MNNTILAIDLGKYKCVACLLDQNTGELRFTTFDTSHAELLKIIAKESPSVVVIEACLLAGWVHNLCGEHGVRPHVLKLLRSPILRTELLRRRRRPFRKNLVVGCECMCACYT